MNKRLIIHIQYFKSNKLRVKEKKGAQLTKQLLNLRS